MRKSAAAAVVALALVSTGCTSMKIDDFQGTQPALTLEGYFEGRTTAWGLFEDRFGDVRRQFVVDIDGDWNPQTGVLVLTEDFRYSDGETDQRIWTIRKTGPNTYEGSAPDVVGTAQGTLAGNAFHWTYTMNLKVGDGTWRVGFDDWMFLQPGGVLLNRASVTKWGIEIGSVSIAFRKDDAAEAAAVTAPRSAAE